MIYCTSLEEQMKTTAPLKSLLIAASLVITLVIISATSYSAMLPDAAELDQSRRQFIEDESARKEAAARRYLLDTAAKMNANQSDYDINYYGIHVSLDFSAESIDAAIDYQFTSLVSALTTIDLNLHDQLNVDSVIYAGAPITFSHFADILSISLPSSLEYGEQAIMTVYYHGQPFHGGGYADGGMAFDNHYGNTVCWTSTEPYNSRYWWPCKDTPSDKADSLELWIECPDYMYAASNGVLLEVTPAGQSRSEYHWKHLYPITTYLVALSVADFDVTTKNWNYDSYNMPVYAFNFPNAYSTISCYDTLTFSVLNHFSDAFGIYPFVNEKLGNADCGVWGTMEHQTCSFHDPFSGYDKEYLVIHENAHQWWGDMITCKTFHDVWLNEGFGTYSEAVFYERQFNSHQFYHDYMNSMRPIGSTGTIYVENPETEPIFDATTSYFKGAWVVHMLRGVIGEDSFFSFLQDWAFSEYRYGSATTADLSNFCSDWMGTDMSWFFNQWIHQPSNPDYEYAWICEPGLERAGYNFYLLIEQVQSHYNAYSMPIQIEISTTGGVIDTAVWNDQRDQFYKFNFDDSVTSVAFDPNDWILRTVDEVEMSTYVPNRCPDAILGEQYYHEIPIFGGTPPFTWSFLGGDIPYGMTYSDGENFVLSGVPTFKATYYMSIQVIDSSDPPAVFNQSVSLTVIDPPYLCGDADNNGQVSITDAVYIINYIFGGGPAPGSNTGDVDCSQSISISDAVYIVNYIFGGGTEPCAGC